MRAHTSISGTFFDDLAPADRAALAEAGTARHYRKGEPLFIAGDAGGFVVLIIAGRVKVTAPAPTGAEAVLTLRGPGDLVGELSALADAPDERVATVVALEPVVCRVVRSGDFRTILAEHPAIALGLLRMVAARLRAADRRIVEFGVYDTVRRLARLLADMAEAAGSGGSRVGPGEHVHVLRTGLTQDDLAGMVGASRESVARGLATLRSLGLVSTGRGRVDVRDLPGLRTFGA
ncbi:MAG TPA: Crp/Fnr family transcriptional regulator [Acidimicrobiales bacterium]|nr:Crp/Fnr family transcriptional regulator [Acidimicrobiales bacterium]